MLGYLPLVRRLVRDPTATHRFLYATSGFNAVTNAFARERLEAAAAELRRKDSPLAALCAAGGLAPDAGPAGPDADARRYLAALAARDQAGLRAAVAQRTARCAQEVLLAREAEEELGAFAPQLASSLSRAGGGGGGGGSAAAGCMTGAVFDVGEACSPSACSMKSTAWLSCSGVNSIGGILRSTIARQANWRE
mmetsp:Transcript_15539/g.50607  ORF Transcript_15539/g.50607 Transcript_15539/m.50607 type:complete len:194 (+) Transcript_15539:407-988(+)